MSLNQIGQQTYAGDVLREGIRLLAEQIEANPLVKFLVSPTNDDTEKDKKYKQIYKKFLEENPNCIKNETQLGVFNANLDNPYKKTEEKTKNKNSELKENNK